MATPHNKADKKDIAPVVLMAGDPLRVKLIAEQYLQDAKLVNEVRCAYAYTGIYKGKKLTVMAHGMGNPSMGIYSHELFHDYDVDTIIRVGSIGALDKKVKVRDIVVGQDCYTTTNYLDLFEKVGPCHLSADEGLLAIAKNMDEKVKSTIHFGTIWCADTFYTDVDQIKVAKEKKLLGVEMESAALYLNANNAGRRAITICTVSDSIVTGESLPADERQTSFHDMIQFALEIALNVQV